MTSKPTLNEAIRLTAPTLKEVAHVGEGGSFRMKIIQAGWGSSGYYPADVLKRDGPKVFRAGTQMFMDHPTLTGEKELPERSVRDLAGVLTSDAAWDKAGLLGPGLYASARVYPDWAWTVESKAQDIGVSIYAYGRAKDGEAEGRKGKILEELTAARSIDFVTVPGAGGRILPLYEAARGADSGAGGQDGALPHSTKERKQMDETAIKELRESREALQGQVTTLTAQVATLTEAKTAADTQNQALRKQLLALETSAIAAEIVNASKLSEAARKRVLESVIGKPVLKEDGTLNADEFRRAATEALDAEAKYLAEAVKGSGVSDMGAGSGAANRDAAIQSAKESLIRMYVGMGYDQKTAEAMAAR